MGFYRHSRIGWRHRLIILYAISFSAISLLTAHAAIEAAVDNDEPDDGSAWATRVFDRPDGKDAQSLSTMTITLANGLERQRELTSFRRDAGLGEEQVLLRFHSPAGIRDTGLLVDSGDDDIRLFLPALERVRRISSSNRGGRFVQSQLYYEDLQVRHPSEDQHRLLADGVYEGVPVKVLESTAIDPSSSVYTKRVSWIHPDLFIPLRVDFYEGGEAPSKRLEVLRLDEMQGYWTATDSLMTDLQRGDSTRITVNSIIYDIGLPDSLFSTSALASPAADPAMPGADR